jgi:predicted DNA-binding protein (UPF0251 family)
VTKLVPTRRGRTKTDFILHKSDDIHLTKVRECEAVALRSVHSGIRYEVAAKNLGIPINTLKTRVHRARKIVLTLREQSKRVGE